VDDDSVLMILLTDVWKVREPETHCSVSRRHTAEVQRSQFFFRIHKICDLRFCNVEYVEFQYVHQTTRRHTKIVIFTPIAIGTPVSHTTARFKLHVFYIIQLPNHTAHDNRSKLRYAKYYEPP
jgi:hypothetical protein